MDGGGRNVLAQPFSQGTHDAFFGLEATYAFVGGYTGGSFGFLTAKNLNKINFATPGLTISSYFNEGQYNLRAYTYGYVQDKDFTAYGMNGQVADMKVNLLIGVNVTLDVLFKKESILTGTLNNMSARVRLFDDAGQLVATWMSSEGVYVDRSGHAIGANGMCNNGCESPPNISEEPLYPFKTDGGDNAAGMTPSSGLKPYNFLPGNTTLLHLLMAGFPIFPATGKGIGGTSFFGDPVFLPGGCDFEIACYPGMYGQYPFPNDGILGAPDYTGGWTAEVDFVNWYANNSMHQAFTNQIDTTGGAVGPFPQYYPPVQGLLMGESYHIIPGTTATSGISLTEDGALDAKGLGFVGHTMAPNHLGPYSQQGVWQIDNAHLSGEASAIFEVDLNGLISGNALAFTWSNEFRPLSWGLVSVVGANGASWNFYTYDGVYEAYLTPGTYKFTISSPGYAAQTFSVVVSPGQSGTGQNLYLEQSNIPVPEFSAIGIVAFSALAASLYLLRRRRR
jgi:hypothetical protein